MLQLHANVLAAAPGSDKHVSVAAAAAVAADTAVGAALRRRCVIRR